MTFGDGDEWYYHLQDSIENGELTIMTQCCINHSGRKATHAIAYRSWNTTLVGKFPSRAVDHVYYCQKCIQRKQYPGMRKTPTGGRIVVVLDVIQ